MTLLLLLLISVQAAPAEERAVTLTCKAPSFKVRRPPLRFVGTVAWPDGVMLKVTVNRLNEALDDGAVVPRLLHLATGLAEVGGRRFEYGIPADGPGLYRVDVALLGDFQRKEILVEVQAGRILERQWSFEFPIWDDGLAGSLAPKLRDVAAMAAECRAMLDQFERASETQGQWQTESKSMVRANALLLQKLEKSELHALYPAAMAQLYYTVRNVQGTSSYFAWKDGRFAGGVSYHANGREMETYRQEKFAWEPLKRYLDEAVRCAGREFGLWVVKDVRRGGAFRPELEQAILDGKGVSEAAVEGRLEALEVGRLGDLEAALRGHRRKE